VVDDVDSNRNLTRTYLEMVGFRVCVAVDGAESIRMFRPGETLNGLLARYDYTAIVHLVGSLPPPPPAEYEG
jgi:CheY-like chemotaxis protein